MDQDPESIKSAFSLTTGQLDQICEPSAGETKAQRLFKLLLISSAWQHSELEEYNDKIHEPVIDGQSVFGLLNAEKLDQELILFAGSRLFMRFNKRTRIAGPFPQPHNLG